MFDRRRSMIVLYLTVAVVSVFALYAWHRRNGLAPTLGDDDLAEEMRSRAAQAVKVAAGEYATELDYSPASVAKVEKILADIHERYKSKPSQSQLVKDGLVWGGYIGEVIRRMKPCHWELNSAVGGEGSFPIVCENEKHETYPVRWCLKRIANGPEENVWHKFSFAVGNADTFGADL